VEAPELPAASDWPPPEAGYDPPPQAAVSKSKNIANPAALEMNSIPFCLLI
jgi:hypothetical protein